MKVVKRVFFIALMIWMLLVINSYAGTATINTEGARIRREPNTSSDVLTIAYNGETVEIIEKSGDWYKIKYGESIGYIREDLLSINEDVKVSDPQEPVVKEETETREEPQINKQENTTEVQENVLPEVEKQIISDVAVRIIPSISASIIGEVKAEAKVTVIQVINSWSCIYYGEKTAWVPSSFLIDKVEETKPQEPESRTGYVNVSDGAIIRKGPSKTSEIITEWGKNKPVEIVGEEGDWYKIIFNGEEAYVAKRLISDSVTITSRGMEEVRELPEEPKAREEAVIKIVYVNTEIANIRSGSSTSFEVVGKVARKDSLEVIAEENGWYKIKTSNGTAYILQSLVVNSLEDVAIPQEPAITEPDIAPSNNVSSATGDAVVSLAKQYLGCSYVYGGSGPKSFDCSGFTQYIYKQFGISLAHSAVTQANNGSYVEKTNLQLGDLVIFRDWDNRSIGHCGIYIGGGNFIHAANSKRGVVTDTLNSGYYYERYVSGRRLF